MTCPYCGAVEPERAERYGLIVQTEPPEVFWRGIRVNGIRPMEARLLMLLVRRGKVSNLALIMLLSPSATSQTLKVHISRIRERLKHTAVAVQSIRGWGYELVSTDR